MFKLISFNKNGEFFFDGKHASVVSLRSKPPAVVFEVYSNCIFELGSMEMAKPQKKLEKSQEIELQTEKLLEFLVFVSKLRYN